MVHTRYHVSASLGRSKDGRFSIAWRPIGKIVFGKNTIVRLRERACPQSPVFVPPNLPQVCVDSIGSHPAAVKSNNNAGGFTLDTVQAWC